MKRMVAVGALILQQDKVLLGKHVPERMGFWKDKWICPGGRLELGEPIKDGVIREVKEETNLDVDLMQFLHTFDRKFTENEKDNHVIYIDYLAKVKGGDLKAGSDLGIVRWFSKAELKAEAEEIHDDTKVLLRKAGLLD